MDVNMPDMDGIQATRAIVSQPYRDTGVIMMSVLNEPDVLRRSMLAGAREFLLKPFSLDERLTSIHNVHVNTPKTDRAAGRHRIQWPSPAASPALDRQIDCYLRRGHQRRGRDVPSIATNLAVATRSSRVSSEWSSWMPIFPFGDIGVMMNITDSKTMLDAVPYLRQIDAGTHQHHRRRALKRCSPACWLHRPRRKPKSLHPDLVRSLSRSFQTMYDVHRHRHAAKLRRSQPGLVRRDRYAAAGRHDGYGCDQGRQAVP